jgi:hypothetical protein
MVADDFRKSAFVVKWEAPLSTPTPRGVAILDTMGVQLREPLDARRWSDVERVLLPQELKNLIRTTQKQVKQRLSPVWEDDLWEVSLAGGKATTRNGGGYNLPLQAIWRGPRSSDQPYSVTKNCQILQVSPAANPATKALNTPPNAPPAPVSRFQCQEVKGWGVDQPRNQLDRFIRT